MWRLKKKVMSQVVHADDFHDDDKSHSLSFFWNGVPISHFYLPIICHIELFLFIVSLYKSTSENLVKSEKWDGEIQVQNFRYDLKCILSQAQRHD